MAEQRRPAGRPAAWLRRRTPAPRRARSAPSASVPSWWLTESLESFHPWCTRPVGVAAGVFDEAVAVDVAVLVDPAQGAIDVVPEPGDELPIARARVVVAGEDHEQRRRVHAAVIAAEGDLAEARHLAGAGLVQDLAGLGVLFGADAVACVAARYASVPRARSGFTQSAFERRDDAVAAERRAEPRHARIHVRAGRHLARHHLDVGGGSVAPLVELLVGREQACTTCGGGSSRSPQPLRRPRRTTACGRGPPVPRTGSSASGCAPGAAQAPRDIAHGRRRGRWARGSNSSTVARTALSSPS